MCLSRSGVRSISGLSRALRMNGAIAFTSCTSSNSTDEHFRHQQPPRIAVAQIDLLQILIEPALGKEILLRLALLGQQRDLRQLRRVRESRDLGDAPIERRRRERGALRLGQHVIAAQPFVRAQAVCARARAARGARRVSPSIMCS